MLSNSEDANENVTLHITIPPPFDQQNHMILPTSRYVPSFEAEVVNMYKKYLLLSLDNNAFHTVLIILVIFVKCHIFIRVVRNYCRHQYLVLASNIQNLHE